MRVEDHWTNSQLSRRRLDAWGGGGAKARWVARRVHHIEGITQQVLLLSTRKQQKAQHRQAAVEEAV
ncbi:hypothetical protein E2C01_047458 [Portunus trituberculatus]|uniref:Uncharacterized protein n=1 Tax=Portunus trituberculatus TaxID=210409 RepID=A0A5B7G3M8_PORTR|nr:hypothetical protein [Portunus trituberculatus]